MQVESKTRVESIDSNWDDTSPKASCLHLRLPTAAPRKGPHITIYRGCRRKTAMPLTNAWRTPAGYCRGHPTDLQNRTSSVFTYRPTCTCSTGTVTLLRGTAARAVRRSGCQEDALSLRARVMGARAIRGRATGGGRLILSAPGSGCGKIPRRFV